MTDALTLSDVLARRLNLQWHEGIAIVRGVAERLLQQESTGLRIPELHQIELYADGSVALAGGGGAKEQVRRLGQLLQAVLNDTEVPVQLRLVLSQATAPTPSYASLSVFDRELAFFERPDRAGLIKAVFVRAQAAGPATAGAVAPTLDSVAPLPEATSATLLAPSHKRNLRRILVTGLALTAAVVVSTAGVLYVRNAGISVKEGEVSRVTVAAADAVGAAMIDGASAVSERVGLGRIVPAEEAATSPAPHAPLPVAPRARVKRDRPAPAAEPIETAAAGNEELFGTVVAYEVPPHLATAPEDANDAESDPVYLPGSEGVTPPVNVRPQLPRELPPTVDLAELSRIEIVIAPNGTVESARLLDDRFDVLGGMFLSAVKAWEFHPATKDGVGVRYRKMILVSFE